MVPVFGRSVMSGLRKRACLGNGEMLYIELRTPLDILSQLYLSIHA